MTAQWRQVFATVVLASFYLAMPPPVVSFATINVIGSGQSSEHERLTRAALACPDKVKSSGDCFEPRSIDQLAGSGGSFGAIGSPDLIPIEEPFPAHCDDADYFDSATYTPSQPYPIAREGATFRLLLCIARMQFRFGQATTEANALLNSQDRISWSEADLIVKGDCTFAPSFKGRAKCNVLEGIGRMLHGIQDFYSHSNWVDAAVPPFTVVNPPGLGLSAPSPLFEMRRTSNLSFPIPNDLSTGCYDGITTDETPGINGCAGRITHKTLNKDRGTINATDGSTKSPTTSRGMFAANFDNAVRAAIIETRTQWRNFRAELEHLYGARRSSLMICAITRDEPVRSCQGRKMAIVVDSSGSNVNTDPSNLRIAAAKAFNSMLITNANAGPDGLADRVTVVDFDSSARVIYPLGDPSAATFNGIDSSGGTYIAGGVATAIGELTKERNDPTADRTGIIVLTDGEDSDTQALVAQINRAESLGIRIAVGFLSPPVLSVRPVTTRELHRREPPAELVTAILKTGGMFSTIHSAETQQSFIDLVITHGPTNLDNAKGSNDGVPLIPSLAVSGLVSAAAGPDIFTYHGLPGDKLNITIQSMKNQPLKAVLYDIRAGILVNETTPDAKGKAIIPFSVINESDFELIISTTDASDVVYSVSLSKIPGSITEFSSRISSSTSSAPSSSSAPPSNRPAEYSPHVSLSTYSTPSNTPAPPLNTPAPLSAEHSPHVSNTPVPPLNSPAPLSNIPALNTPAPPLNTPAPPSSSQVTSCTTYWTTLTAERPSSTIAGHHRRKRAISPHIDSTLATSLPADSKETVESSTGVYALLISIIGAQSALILGSIIWWSCFGNGQIALQSDTRVRFVPEWMAPRTSASRLGYSKPAPLETEKLNTL